MSYLGTDKEPMILIDQNSIAKERLSEIKINYSIGKSEKELDSYLIKRGIKDNALTQLKLSLEDLKQGRFRRVA